MNTWIRVTDKLPETDVRVLVTDGKMVDIDTMRFTLLLNNPIWMYVDEVTHWMPLPKRPASES